MRVGALFFSGVLALVVAGPLLGHPRMQSDEKQQQATTRQALFGGEWTANLSKSERDPNHQFQSATLQFTVEGDTVTLTYGGVNASGEEETGTLTLHTDGREHPVSERAPGVVAVSRWIGPHVLETAAKKDGQTVSRGTYEVSSDGKTLTAWVSGKDASGTDFEQMIVFDRK